MDILERLFGSLAKVKIIKLFLFHPEEVFDADEIRKRTQTAPRSARKELATLEKIGLLKPRTVIQNLKQKRSGRTTKKVSGWVLNDQFPYLSPLKSMLIYTSPFQDTDIIKKLQAGGSLKLVVISGIFLQEWEARIDLMVVGDNLKMNSLYTVIRSLESDMGREIRYTIFTTTDFQYRLLMCDKLIRDVLDSPHEKIVNKIDA